MKRCLLVLLTIVVIIPCRLIAYPSVTYLGIENGLSNNSVRCVYQDREGFIWFGTHYGLNRYDGNEFKIFTNNLRDSTSLPHNYIYTLHEDCFKNLWVSTGQAMAVYNRVADNFLPVNYIRYRSRQPELITFGVTTINSDAAGNVFFATDLGLLVKKRADSSAFQVPLNLAGEVTTNYSVRAITILNDRIWLLINNRGLATYDIKSNKIELVNTTLKDGICLQADGRDNFWVAAESGLYKYAIAANSFPERYKVGEGQLNSPLVTTICYDRHGKLWIGTDGAGINIFDTATRTFSYLLQGEGKNQLSSSSVISIIDDNEGRMWIGTLRGGCNIIDEQKNRFTTIARVPFNDNSLPSNFIYSFCEDKDGDLLVGTDGGGLSVWDRNKNTFRNYANVPGNPSSLSNNWVASIRQDAYGDTWIGTYGGGINKFNKALGTFEHYACVNEATGAENKVAWLLFEDHEKELWACTYGDGRLYHFNRSLNKFEVYSQNLINLVSMAEDSQGNLWAGTSTTLIQIDRSVNGRHRRFEIDRPVRAIYEDKQHRLWLGIEGGGLILFDGKKGEIIHRYSESDGLCNNAILNILEDDDGNLWLSTFNGLSKFDPGKKTFKNFYQSDGLQGNQFSYRAALKLRSGQLVFGGIKGFNIFNPQKITTREYMPPVYLTRISVNNETVSGGSKYIATTGDAGISGLEIPYKEAVLSFGFTALEYSAPDKIQYAYFLEGWDKGWNYPGNARTANYTRLDEGSYKLHVKSTNAAGEWNKNEKILQVTVLPPWYRSWWAYTLYSLLAVGALVLFLAYKREQTRLEYEVKLAHLDAEKEKELNEKKLTFFTNISHEFRTPLTLIINPVKDLLYQKHRNVETGELNVVYRNARRLLSLVDQLLLFRKAGSETDSLRVSKVNFTELCHEVYLCFTQQAKLKHIQYEIDSSSDQVELYLDAEKIEIALFNLISNAIKYTAANGTIKVVVGATPEGAMVRVIDNGRGISPAKAEKLFNRFYQVKEIGGETGFGIGLYVAKTFVEKHKGVIGFESNAGNGSIFSISLLAGKDHFDEDTLFEDSSVSSNFLQELTEEPAEVEAEEETGMHEPVEKKAAAALVSDDRRLLVIDDNEQIRKYIMQVFTPGFEVYDADNATDGLKKARQLVPDIIISDVVMQGMTGIDLCQVIKTDSSLSHIPVILLTASSAADVKLKGIECGADDYITKPFEKDLLVARVENLLKSRNTLQKYFYNAVTLQENNVRISEEYKEFLERCMTIVEESIDKDDFSIKMLASELGMSHSNLYKKVKSISGQSVNAFIRFIRLRKAAELFINTNCNVSEAAFQVGISDPRYFRDQFNQLFGMNPSDYIKKYRQPFQKKYNLNEKVLKGSDEG